RAAAKEVGAVALAALLVREQVPLRGIALEVVQRGDGARTARERRMTRDVLDTLGAHVDAAPVSQPLELLLPGGEHRLAASSRRCASPGTSSWRCRTSPSPRSARR